MYEIIYSFNFSGLLVGIVTLLIIGFFHPLVVKGEYYFGIRIRWVFLAMGIAGIIGSLLTKNIIVSSALGVLAFSSFWSIKEVFEQRDRVRKGWFPENPKRKGKS